MRSVYITSSAVPRPLMKTINGCRKTAKKPWKTVNYHHSGCRAYNPQGIWRADSYVIGLHLIGHCSTKGEMGFPGALDFQA
jgi:hypothetical protein